MMWCFEKQVSLDVSLVEYLGSGERRSGGNLRERNLDVSSITFADFVQSLFHKMIALSTNGADRMGFC